MSQEPRSRALAALAQFLVADAPLGSTLQRIAEIAVDAIPGARYVGLSMLDDRGQVTTGVFTDPDSPCIDAAQYDSGHGPCLDAWRTGQIICLDDLDDARARYPEFAATASDHGIHSTLSIPMICGGAGIAALNFYADQKAAFTAADEAIGLELATAAAVVLANAAAYWGVYDLAQNLNQALRSRAIIDQAKGMLMAHNPAVTADGAFEILKQASQRENVKLRDLAQRIVNRDRPALCDTP